MVQNPCNWLSTINALLANSDTWPT